jgi:hypothetical protein
MSVKRTQYTNLSTGGPRDDPTGHGESLVDMESYLMPMASLQTAALHGAGVAAGLLVSATAGSAEVSVGLGSAVDGFGRLIALSEGGRAITDPTVVDRSQMQNVPMVVVTAAGVTLDTAASAATVMLLTVSWREVEDPGHSDAPQLLHTPWFRLVPATGFTDDEQVVLAELAMAGGVVTGLTPGSRRFVDTTTGRLELSRPRLNGSGQQVDQVPLAELVTRADGGVDLNLLGAVAASRPAVSVTGTAGDVVLTAGLRVRDRLVVDAAGNVAVGGTHPTARTLHVEGSEVHTGGAGAGFSFADRTHAGGRFVEQPMKGERWVWYAMAGRARLWSGNDRLSVEATGVRVHGRLHVDGVLHSDGPLEVGGPARAGVRVTGDAVVGAGGNGVLSVRHVNGKSWLDDGPDDLLLNWDTGRAVHVGGGTRASLLVHGDAVVGAGGDGAVITRHVKGKHWQSDAADDLYLNWDTGRGVHVGGSVPAHLRVHGNAFANWPDTLNLASWSGGGVGVWDLFARGGVFVGEDPEHPRVKIWNDGTVSAVTKRFVIDHPLDPKRDLVHASIEGPETAVYYRGEGRLGDGRASVRLPHYFEHLARPDGRTVMVTAVCDPDGPVGQVAATPVRDGSFVVRGAPGCPPDQRFYWEVKAVRADVEPLAVETVKASALMLAGGST